MMLGRAAVAMWADVSPEAKPEFDDWHVHEHMPERLSIPGFLRGTRWVSTDGKNGYFICYEAAEIATVTSGPYLERLNNPTPWSRRMMPHHQNMRRSLCRVAASHGAGLGHFLLTARFDAKPALDLAALPARRGFVSAHLLERVEQASGPTEEQKIRGQDASAAWIVLVTGTDEAALAGLDLPGAAARRLHSLAFVLTPADLA